MGEPRESCNHKQCCLCLKRECNVHRNFIQYGSLYVCGSSCVSTAVHLAYKAACMFGGAQEIPCGSVRDGVEG